MSTVVAAGEFLLLPSLYVDRGDEKCEAEGDLRYP